MSLELSPDNERYLRELVARGQYRDEATAIEDALEVLKRRERLRSEVRAGIEQADRGQLLDADEVLERLLGRARQIAANPSRSS